jgi:branched-chain amino acid transport system substrate-binding protein
VFVEGSRSRRDFVKKAAIAGGVVLGFPALIPKRTEAEETLNIGVDEELTGVYAYPAKNEVRGMQMAVDDWNKKGGVLGRKINLLVEDNANNPGTAVEKARKLFEVDKVPVLIGTLNSANSQAVSNVAFQAGKPFLVSGGHTDTVTGSQCHWTSFRTCHSTWAETHATGLSISKKFGKKWYYITPDYAFGHSLLDGYKSMEAQLGIQVVGSDLTPLGTTDFSAYLTKVLAAKPDCLIIMVQGDDQTNCLKQANSFGILKRIPVAGPQGELEPLWGVPKEAQVGYWGVEWYYKNVGNNKEAQSFVSRYMTQFQEPPTARSAFGYITVERMATAIQEAKGTDPVKVCKALSGMTFHPLQQGSGTYRTVDHQLEWPMLFCETVAGGQDGNAKDIFKMIDVQPGDAIEHPVSEQEKVCKLAWPA